MHIMKALVSVRPMVVLLFQVLLLRRGTYKSDFCTNIVAEAKDGQYARVAGLGQPYDAVLLPFACQIGARARDSVRVRLPAGQLNPGDST